MEDFYLGSEGVLTKVGPGHTPVLMQGVYIVSKMQCVYNV